MKAWLDGWPIDILKRLGKYYLNHSGTKTYKRALKYQKDHPGLKIPSKQLFVKYLRNKLDLRKRTGPKPSLRDGSDKKDKRNNNPPRERVKAEIEEFRLTTIAKIDTARAKILIRLQDMMDQVDKGEELSKDDRKELLAIMAQVASIINASERRFIKPDIQVNVFIGQLVIEWGKVLADELDEETYNRVTRRLEAIDVAPG